MYILKFDEMGTNSKKATDLISGSPFFILLALVGIVAMGYMGIWGLINTNFRTFGAGVIFFLFIIIGMEIDIRIFKEESIFKNSAGMFSLGFVLWTLFSKLGSLSILKLKSLFSAFSPSPQFLLSQVTAQMPPFWAYVVNNLGAPIAEELFFLIFLPELLFRFFGKVGPKNLYLQVFLSVAFTSTAFAWFHVGSATIVGFFISAMLFRAMTMIMTYGDKELNMIPRISVLYSSMVGVHMANNVAASGGLLFAVDMLSTELFGIVLLVVFVGIFVVGAWHWIGKVR